MGISYSIQFYTSWEKPNQIVKFLYDVLGCIIMLSLTATTILLIIIIGFIIISVLKSAIKVALSLSFLLLILIIVGGYFFVADLNSFRNDFFHNQTTYILEDNETLITAFSLQGLNVSSFEPVSINEAQLLITNSQNISEGKLFVINKEVLTEKSSKELFDLTGYSFEDALVSDNNKLRASAFLISFVATFKEEGIFYFFRQVREHRMAILPKTFAIKVLTFNSNKYLSKIKIAIDKHKNLIKGFTNVINDSKNILGDNLTI